MAESSIAMLILEYADEKGAAHLRELHIEIERHRPGTPEHTIRARLSEAVSDGILSRLGGEFYDIYAEDEGMTSLVSYQPRENAWGLCGAPRRSQTLPEIPHTAPDAVRPIAQIMSQAAAGIPGLPASRRLAVVFPLDLLQLLQRVPHLAKVVAIADLRVKPLHVCHQLPPVPLDLDIHLRPARRI